MEWLVDLPGVDLIGAIQALCKPFESLSGAIAINSVYGISCTTEINDAISDGSPVSLSGLVCFNVAAVLIFENLHLCLGLIFTFFEPSFTALSQEQRVEVDQMPDFFEFETARVALDSFSLVLLSFLLGRTCHDRATSDD